MTKSLPIYLVPDSHLNPQEAQYLNMMMETHTTGQIKTDRTGTGTRSVFGQMMRFNLQEGFPLLTTKKIHLKSIIHELIWFLAGDTNIKYLKDNGVSIWDEWCQQESEFGNTFEGREMVYVKPITFDYSEYYNPDSSLTTQAPAGSIEDKLRNTWFKMMNRCYNKEAHNYRFYGERNVFVCKRWHKLENFIQDVQHLPNWKHKRDNWNDYSLDKDYYSSNCYSPETTLWLGNEENAMYGECSTLIVVTPAGNAEMYPSINQAAKEIDIERSSLHRFTKSIPDVLKGNNKKIRGWKFIITDEPFRYGFAKKGDLGPVYGKQWRNWGGGKVSQEAVNKLLDEVGDKEDLFALKLVELFKEKETNGIDQITEALNLIKHNPDSRRIIVSGWNVADVPKVKLPPCHTLYQFYVSDLTPEERLSKVTFEGEDSESLTFEQKIALADIKGVPRKKLSCMLYARSQDTFLGTPFNIASYAILTHMFAQQADMAVGDFVWVGGDVHVYSNHTDQVDLQLSRDVRKMPQLVIKRKPESIFDYKFEDFEIQNYDPHAAIKAPVAV